MMLEDVVRSSTLRARARGDPLGPHSDHMLAIIASVGYTRVSLRELVYGVIQFGTYLREQGVADLGQMRLHHVESFVAGRPLRRRVSKQGVRGARHLWRYACAVGITTPEPVSTPHYTPLLEEWLGFLERHRGLAPKSLALYRRHIRRFLERLGPVATQVGLRRLEAGCIRDYLTHACKERSRSERKAILSTLRIFLRFAWSRGYLTHDLSLAVERGAQLQARASATWSPMGGCTATS